MEVKDYPNLLKAFAKLHEAHLPAKLWIAGDGDLLVQLQDLSRALGVHNHVRFLGMRTDIPELLNAADVFVLPSRFEGFGIVVAEAMATEKVVVATDCGGVKEVLGSCGFLVRPGDSEELAGALRDALLLGDEKAKEIGRQARRRVETFFSIEAIADRWAELYEITCLKASTQALRAPDLR